MFRSSFRRSRRGRLPWLRFALIVLGILFIIDLVRIKFVGPSVPGVSPSFVPKDRVFIASIHWNNEAILRSHWNAAILNLVQHLGPENVYVAILESGSWDDSKGALRELDAELEQLGVERSVELEQQTHKDEIERLPATGEPGWVWTSRGRKELRRIPYLSTLRNRLLRRMRELAERRVQTRVFDKVLWLNDVVFTTDDVLALLKTRGGEYAAVCSLDFSKPPLYYDTFALRDLSGAKAVIQTWPYFLSYASRHALMSNQPVPVRSCWNGMVVFDAAAFYTQPPLEFRGLADSLAARHLEGSECCLIHADNQLSVDKGVWLNPNVRVGYNPEAYEIVNPSSGADWPAPWEKFVGIWNNRLARLSGWPRRVVENLVIRKRIRSWKAAESSLGEGRQEPGIYCLINEMQVLIENGWAHV